MHWKSWLAIAGLVLAGNSPAAEFTRITGENGTVDYDPLKNEGNGWYSEAPGGYRFKLGYKQGERKSPAPILVATLQPTAAEAFRGSRSLELRISGNQELKSLKAAYKVDIASVKPGDPFAPTMDPGKEWLHEFALKIDPAEYQLPQAAGQELTFEQWWQGSPFHPPIALVILNETDARAKGWPDANPAGNFALVLRDDQHNAWESGPGKPRYFNLGAVKTGRWIEWRVAVRPSPSKPEGSVTVSMDGAEMLKLEQQIVGYDPANYAVKPKPSPVISYVSCCLYRVNGPSRQRFFFDEIRFSGPSPDP
jgi:hypothetical protein